MKVQLFKRKSGHPQENSSKAGIKGTRILVIEDEEVIRNLLTTILEAEGCIIKTAQNGKEAMRIFSTASYDIVITDIAMPEKDGIDTIIELRQITPPVGIIAMSGVGSSVKLLRLARAFDADTTLKKPFTREELISAITFVKEKMSKE